MRSDVSLDGPVEMPICPDCHTPLVWASTKPVASLGRDNLWQCPMCEEVFRCSLLEVEA